MAYEEQELKPLSETHSKTVYSVDKSSSKKELVDEHKRLVGVLESPSHDDDKEEAKRQAKELKELKEGKEYKPAKVSKSLERANSLLKSLKESLNEEDMDLKKTDDEEEEKTEKSLDYIVKALRASAIIGLSRRQRMDAAYRAGVHMGSNTPMYTEPAGIDVPKLGLEAHHVRPDYEPPAVPIRSIDTPFEIPPKKCGDHTYKSAKVGPMDSKPYWRR